MEKTITKDKKRDDVATIVAKIHGVSPSYVRMVRNGVRKNDEILATLIDFRQSQKKLIEHLQKLIPVKANPKKYAR